MRKLEVGKFWLEIFDSIDELSSERFQKFNKYLLIDSGVGSDINDFNTHATRIAKLVKSDPDQAIRELENLKLSMYMISEEINPKHLAFVTLINKINGKPLINLSDSNIREISKQLSSIKKSEADDLVQTVKKKIDEELNEYFPNRFDGATTNEYYTSLKQRTLLELGKLLRKEQNDKRIEKIDEYLMSITKPAIFFGKDNAEIKYDKQYEEMCVLLKDKLGVDAKQMTVLEFFNAFDYLKKQMKPHRNG